MDREEFKAEINKAIDKIHRMRPVPPNDDLNDPTWSKVDKLIKKLLNWLVRDEVDKPIDALKEMTWGLAMRSLAPPVQTLSWRVLDTWLLIYESRRIRAIAKSDEPWNLTEPSHPVYIPPSCDKSLYEGGAKDALKVIHDKLRARDILKARKGD